MSDQVATVNCQTGEVVLRPMTADELAQRQHDHDAAAKQAAEPDPPTANELIVAAVMAAVPTADPKAIAAALEPVAVELATTPTEGVTP